MKNQTAAPAEQVKEKHYLIEIVGRNGYQSYYDDDCENFVNADEAAEYAKMVAKDIANDKKLRSRYGCVHIHTADIDGESLNDSLQSFYITAPRMHYYLLTKSQYSYLGIREVDKNISTSALDEMVENVIQGHHCDFDSVILICSTQELYVSTGREENHPANGRRGTHTTYSIAVQGDDYEEVDYEVLSDNLLYTGINCDNSMEMGCDDDGRCIDLAQLPDNKNAEDYYDVDIESENYFDVEKLTADGIELFDDEDDYLRHATIEDAAGVCLEAIEAINNKEEENN